MQTKENHIDVVQIGGKEFTTMLKGGADRLAAFREQVNDLNVFPIPDGDTGDNMLMTFGSGKDAALNADDNLSEKAKAAANGMLLGARGNSGVILSRIFAGITKVLSAFEHASVIDLAGGMSEGVKEAYKAVSEPVEGTILTVFKDAVTYANKRAENNESITLYLQDMLDEMGRSLERTPDLLPVLKEAGVVDSGGAGLLCIFEGMLDALNGGLEINDTEEVIQTEKKTHVDFSLFTEDSVLEFGYCTEFLLRLQRSKIDVDNFDIESFKDFLSENGDSVVAFTEGTVLKVHVHTKTPAVIINFAQQYGEFLTFKMENMTFQNKEAVARGNNAQETLYNAAKKEETAVTTAENDVLEEENTAKTHLSFKTNARKKTGLVAVAAGAGIKDTFAALGVDQVVDGGQCMNPSAGDIIKAFDLVNADRIFVFPNNGNVILTAEQAAKLYDKSEIVIIPTHSVGEGYAAISMMDTNSDTDSIKEELSEVISDIVTGFVSKASRNAQLSGITVRQGDYIGFAGDAVYADSNDKDVALKTLVESLNAQDYGVMLVFAGETADVDATQKLCDEFANAYPDTEVIFIDGKQPIYDYMIVLE